MSGHEKKSGMRSRRTLVAVLCAISLAFIFLPSAVQAQSGLGTKVYINTATTTTVLAGTGFIDSVTINGGTGGVVTLYDIAGTGCSGTPASGKFAAIASATSPVTLFYNARVTNGLCIVTAAATDLTVTVN